MDVLIQLFLPIAIATMMLSLGLGLTVRDFVQVLRYPKPYLCGLTLQIFIVPLMSFLIIQAYGLTGSIAIGFMLLSACPGGGVSNVITKFGRGDVALSISLTATTSLICALTLPIVLTISIHSFGQTTKGDINIWDIAFRTFSICFVPIVLGVFLRSTFPASAQNLCHGLTKLSPVLLGLIIIGAVAGNWALFVANMWRLGGALTTMMIILCAVGYLIPAAMGLGKLSARTISIEAGIQNGALGIGVATVLSFQSTGFSDYSLASALYGVMMYFIVVPLAYFYRKRPLKSL